MNEGNLQFFVAVNHKEGYMESRRIAERHDTQVGDKFTIGDLVFTDCGVLKAK